MSATQARARALLDRFNTLTDEYHQLVNRTIDHALDDEYPIDLTASEAELLDLTAKFSALERDVDEASRDMDHNGQPAFA